MLLPSYQVFPTNNAISPPVSVGGGADFFTDFPATEDPISQGGIWINGGTNGLNWQDCETTPGKCFATNFASATSQGNEFDDPICHLRTSYRVFNNNHFSQGVVSRAPGYSPNTEHENELWVCANGETPHVWTGYEILWAHNGESAVVRWNGPPFADDPNAFTQLGAIVDIGAAVDGDVLRAERSGNDIIVYKNGVLKYTRTDATWIGGQPGMGFWPRFVAPPQVVFDSYCWKSFRAGNL